jgi:hypothetical protein
MKPVSILIIGLIGLLGSVLAAPSLAADASDEPLFSLTADAEPLGDLLHEIARQTGYQFTLDGQWQDHPVSAAITNLPLEQGLKRLLRSLNHTIIWDSDRHITIMVFGKADPVRPSTAVSYGAPPQDAEPDIDLPADDDTTVETESEAVDTAETASQPAAADDSPEDESSDRETDAAGKPKPADE